MNLFLLGRLRAHATAVPGTTPNGRNHRPRYLPADTTTLEQTRSKEHGQQMNGSREDNFGSQLFLENLIRHRYLGPLRFIQNRKLFKEIGHQGRIFPWIGRKRSFTNFPLNQINLCCCGNQLYLF